MMFSFVPNFLSLLHTWDICIVKHLWSKALSVQFLCIIGTVRVAWLEEHVSFSAPVYGDLPIHIVRYAIKLQYDYIYILIMLGDGLLYSLVWPVLLQPHTNYPVDPWNGLGLDLHHCMHPWNEVCCSYGMTLMVASYQVGKISWLKRMISLMKT